MTDPTPTRRPLRQRRLIAGAAAASLLVLGGGAGALAVAASRPSVIMAPATPKTIRALSDNGIVTVRGRVVEIYGNKFVMADSSGRALVDTGREGENGTLVQTNEAITVQGRFGHGILHAAFLLGPDGKVSALGPLGGPPEGHRGHHGPHGDGPHGEGLGRDGPDDDGRAAPPVRQPAAAQPTAAQPTAH